jgi:hypothetical protein
MEWRAALFIERCNFASNVQIPKVVNEREALRAVWRRSAASSDPEIFWNNGAASSGLLRNHLRRSSESARQANELLLLDGNISTFPVASEHQTNRHIHLFADRQMP